MLEETVEEEESRLAKRRETWKEKTAEANGKQKEYQRVYGQQKIAAELESTEETAEERHTRNYNILEFVKYMTKK